MLSQTQVQHFRQEGYLLVPGFFDQSEVRLLQSEVNRLRQASLLRNVRTDGDGQTTSSTRHNLQLCPAYPHSRAVRALPFSTKVSSAVSALLGDPVLYHLDQIFYKPAKTGDGTSWHTDNAYFRYPDPTRGTGMWIAVHDANVENGTMHIIPRSHEQEWSHERDQNSDHHIRCNPNEANALPVELAAGGVIFFNYGTLHCTHPNKSDADRAGLAYHFQHHAGPVIAKEARDAPSINANALVSGPEASFGQRELGETLDGVWDQLCKQAPLVPTENPERSVAGGAL